VSNSSCSRRNSLSGPTDHSSLPNGPGAAAILAAGIGSGALGVLAFAGDTFPAVRRALTFWTPTGPLSGVSLLTIVVWLVAWYGLSRRWGTSDVSLLRINVAAFLLLVLGVLLTFPPVMDLLHGG
jgi:hypothetical protein